MNQPSLFFYYISIGIFILLSAFFSASETAFISLGRHHLQKIAGRKDKRAKRMGLWFEDPNKILVTALVGNNIVNISASVMAAALSYRYFHKFSAIIITGIMTFLILVFGEIIPKSFAKKYSESVAYFFAIPVKFFSILFKPVIKVLLVFSEFLIRIFGGRIESIIPVLTEEDLKAMISAGEEEGIIEEEERNMIDSIFELGDKMVREVMTARINIVAVSEDSSLEEVINLMAREGYSRIPVYKDNIDRITGIVYIKDIVAMRIPESQQGQQARTRDCMRHPYFVPESKKISELLRELQEKKMQMAIVVDEYGGTGGLVTMEDLLEEIVGEISDEYKKEVKELQSQEDGSFLVSGEMEIEKANEQIGMDIPVGEFETIAGFVLDRLGKFPLKGESFVYRGYEFLIQDSDTKKVRLVRIKKKGEPDE